MDKHTEIIFNLFIMKYFNTSCGYPEDYHSNVMEVIYRSISSADNFKSYKSCFPENEIACQTLVSGQYEIDFPCNIIHEKTTTVKARKIKSAKYNKKTKNWEL